MFRLLVAIFLVLISASTLFAQDENQYFPIVENCIPEPVLPPDDWTYDGTIMMDGYAGIHGMNAEWDTPRVLMFDTYAPNGDSPVYGTELSPDGKWLAVPMGETWTEPSFNQYTNVRGVRVYPTDGSLEYIDFRMEEYDFFSYFPRAWSFIPVQWVDNESFVMGDILVHPFEGKVELATIDTGWSTLNVRAYSPDTSLAFSGYPIGSDYKYGLYDPTDPETTFIEISPLDGLSWKRDSTDFIAIVENEEFEPTYLALYNRYGEKIKDVLSVKDRRFEFVETVDIRRNETQWSPDNKLFVLTWQPQTYQGTTPIYIIDFETEQIIDTCLRTSNIPVWSPDGKMLAFLKTTRNNQNIVVVDLELQKAYIVGKHLGSGSAMVGWRE